MSLLQYGIGVDLGGTTVKTGIVSSDGKIHSQTVLPSLADQGPKTVIAQIKTAIHDTLKIVDGKTITGIGIGAPGVVEKEKGVVKNPPNFPGWNEVALGEEIHDSFGVNVEVENDANAAAIAEAKFGAGKNYPNFLFVIWGTGVGGGIISNGKIYRGPSGGAGEIGHISINFDGPRCNCGAKGCVEVYVGQRHLSMLAAQRVAGNPRSKILEFCGGDLSTIEPLHISQAADAGDALAQDILVKAGKHLGIAIAAVMHTLDFRVSIIGGGISAAGKYVFDAVTESVKSHVLAPMRKDILVVPAVLRNSAGILGAAGLVL
ncbi:MAG: ROK family protein [Bacteroidota bacterium]|nr:ROK family protein [Bacteroidota bacterium]